MLHSQILTDFSTVKALNYMVAKNLHPLMYTVATTYTSRFFIHEIL